MVSYNKNKWALPSDTNQLYVSCLVNGCTDSDLRSALEHYGPIENINLMLNKDCRKSFAFVLFENGEDRDAAALDHETRNSTAVTDRETETEPPLYRFLRKATMEPKLGRKGQRKRKDAERTKEEAIRLATVMPEGQSVSQGVTSSETIVLQCACSHLERLEDYIGGDPRALMEHVKVVGSMRTKSRTIALLILRVDTTDLEATHTRTSDIARAIVSDPHSIRALNKVFVLETDCFVGTFADGLLPEAIKRVNSLTLSGKSAPLRVQTFPPTLTRTLVDGITTGCPDVELVPTEFKHLLSVVQLDDEVYMLGMSNGASFQVDRSGKEFSDNESSVNRAYFKIQEVFVRYQNEELATDSVRADVYSFCKGKTALDCGASPGGWTKFLIENGCKKIYSVDPGELSHHVLPLEECMYMQMTVQTAIPIIKAEQYNKDGCDKIGVYVSDMCLWQMSDQLDLMFQARESGVLSPNTLFVLTLKCITGKCKASYDAQVAKVVAKLDGVAVGVKTIHLFMNRSGERTVMGYLK